MFSRNIQFLISGPADAEIEIDRDLVESPPAIVISSGYERLFEAHVKQSRDHFIAALPKRRFSSLFKSKLALDPGKLGDDFEGVYRKLLTETAIHLPEGESPDADPQSTTFRAVVVFLTEARTLIVPDRFLKPARCIVDTGSARDADMVASCFPYETIRVTAAILANSGLTTERSKEVCRIASSDIAMDFDQFDLDQQVDGQAIAPILCYFTSLGQLVLLPCAAALHEYVEGNLSEYFDREARAE